MRITIGTHQTTGEVTMSASRELLEESCEIDIEPNAAGEDPHLCVTVELNGETFEGRLPLNHEKPHPRL